MLRECAHLHIVVARNSHRIGYKLQRALHLLEARLLEEVRLEQRLQNRAHLIARIDIRLCQRIHRVRVVGRRVGPRRHLRLIRHEEVIQVPSDKLPRRRLLHDDVYDVFTVEGPRFAEEGLLAVVVVPLSILEARMIEQVRHARQRVGVCPPRERPRRRLHIVLGVVADAHREQLHQFAPIVLVRRAVVVVAVVQPVNHRRIFGNLKQQFAEVPHCMSMQHLVVMPHRRPGVKLRESCGQNAMPEQRHLLFQRPARVQNAVQPTTRRPHEPLRVHMHRRKPQRDVVIRLRLAHRIQQPVNSRVIPLFRQRLNLIVTRPKTRAPHQVRYQSSIIR